MIVAHYDLLVAISPSTMSKQSLLGQQHLLASPTSANGLASKDAFISSKWQTR